MINKETFDQLKNHQADRCLSIYIPTEIAGDYEKNRIRWKNAVQEARQTMEAQDLSPRVIDMILAPAEQMDDDTEFWANQSAGLAGFYADGYQQLVHLPKAPHDLSIVSDRFLLHPLLPSLINKERLFILALSQNDVRFFEAHKNAIFPVKISDLVPANMEEALMLDKDEKALQWHTVGGDNANFHGQGAGDDMSNIRLEQYFRKIDEGLQPIYRDETVPLILAALPRNQAIYRKVTEYNYLHDFSIDMNPENSDPVALHTEVLSLFDNMEYDDLRTAMETFHAKKAKNLATDDLDSALKAAKFENVDTLIVSMAHSEDEETELKMEELLMKAYESGAKLLFTEAEKINGSKVNLIKRFDMELGG